VPVLLGVLPLQSARHAEFLHNEVPGITVPAEARAAMAAAGERGAAVGVELSLALIAAVEGSVSGTYLMPSFGRYEQAAEVVVGSALGWRETGAPGAAASWTALTPTLPDRARRLASCHHAAPRADPRARRRDGHDAPGYSSTRPPSEATGSPMPHRPAGDNDPSA
jgi:hypothetical protein